MQPIHQFHNWVSQPRMLPQWEQRLRSPHPSICDDGRMFSISIVAKYRKVAFEIVWYSVSYSKYSKLCALWMPHGWIGAKKSRAYEDIWSWIVMCLAFGCLWSVRTSMQSSTTKCCRFPILDITEIPAAGNTTSSRHWKSDRWRGDSCKAVSMTRWPTYYENIYEESTHPTTSTTTTFARQNSCWMPSKSVARPGLNLRVRIVYKIGPELARLNTWCQD